MSKNIDVIICDECQFLTAEQVDDLNFSSEHDIPVLCWLRTDFVTNLFPSGRLFELADSITEIKSVVAVVEKQLLIPDLMKRVCMY